MLIKEIIKPTETGIEIHKKYDNNVYLDEVKKIRDQLIADPYQVRRRPTFCVLFGILPKYPRL